MTSTKPGPSQLGAPPALLAIIQAARANGNRDLERAARRELAERHGIELTFRRQQTMSGVPHAKD